MSATLEAYRKRLQSLPESLGNAGRSHSIVATRALLRDMAEDIRGLLDGGHSATAIAKTLAPRGERPSWETVRRAIAEEFDLPRATRKHGRRNAVRGVKRSSGEEDGKKPIRQQGSPVTPQDNASTASAAIAKVNAGKSLFAKVQS